MTNIYIYDTNVAVEGTLKKKNHGDATITVAVYMPSDRAVQVKEAAAAEELSISQLVNRAVKEYLEKRA